MLVPFGTKTKMEGRVARRFPASPAAETGVVINQSEEQRFILRGLSTIKRRSIELKITLCEGAAFRRTVSSFALHLCRSLRRPSWPLWLDMIVSDRGSAL